MKKGLVLMAMGGALAFSAASYAAGDMAGMDMSGGTKQEAAAQQGMSHGEIRKVDTAAGKLTIKHGPLENLGMDAMTMVFKVKDPAMLSQVKAGDKIDFVAEDVDGALTVVELKKP
ncbi:TPA: copper-binding protein [Burkholderia aenigmatica]|uniref:copper-binding protein n=1 Tax=Burkholderia sp. AU45251 TaxID=3059204 RepID=UPI0026521311|nr:copper-binding protein [Burkholderia sp. AU45251]HDR9487587.1 copper-binding protein [Burkholderia aenigmatica]MDN7520446.1 copper-binding protein [Burkholderia sp. AU45251]HDR9519365.1 copper-binding protein [Burkholderia aenigmatica]HDR9596395.1 copper-binding protein [Burkholderia aenigmatica]HDR9603650.1 copper-binding protein [Burkholderia aenigmatica]